MTKVERLLIWQEIDALEEFIAEEKRAHEPA